MTDLSDDERAIGSRIHAWADGNVPTRDPRAVAAAAMASHAGSRWRRPAASRSLALVAALVVAVGGSFGALAVVSQQNASRLAGAVVNDRDYTVAIARSLTVSSDSLERFGSVGSLSAIAAVEGPEVYAIKGVSPDLALVMKLVPGQRDDSGPIGEYLLLVRGGDAFAKLCPFFERGNPATPSLCR